MPIKNPELLPLFEELKKLLAPYASSFTVKEPEPGRYELWSTANTAPPGKPFYNPYFVGLIIQKSYVGLYYMPIYTDPDISSQIGSALMALLKGKSCFYVKSLSPELREQICDALETGLELYKSKGWV